MKIPKTFESDIQATYNGDLSIDELITRYQDFLRSLGKYALRYQTTWYISDEDDMFQEACIWLMRALWDWDESRGVSLSRYVVYNIGVRLGTQVEHERAKKRHPSAVKLDLWGSRGKDADNFTWEETLHNSTDIETIVAIRRALVAASNELTDLAKMLLVALIDNGGNFAGASRDLYEKNEIRSRFGPDQEHLKYVLRRKVMPEIFNFLEPTHIIPSKQVV